MARPTKQGIDYFPVDVEWDEKVEMFSIENEAEGIGILVTLWQLIYKNEGYYIENGNDLFLLLKKRTGCGIDVCRNSVNACINRKIFNKDLYERHGILTSKAIQKRYFDIAKRKRVVNVCKNYLCNGIDVHDNWVYVDINATKEEVKEDEDVNVNNNGLG